MVTRAIQSAQTQVEQQNFEIRKNVLKYDEVMDLQRKVIYAERRRVLEGEDLGEQVQHMITDVVTAYVNGATENGYVEDWDLDQLWSALRTLYPVGIKYEDIAGNTEDLTRDTLLAAVLEDARAAYARREAELEQMAGPDAMRELERRVVLSVLDRKWREHLYEMDYLKEGIGLRAMAQRDPLVEYKREGFEMFSALLEGLKEESVGFLFNVQVQVAAPEVPAEPAPAAVAAAAPGPALSQIDGQTGESAAPAAPAAGLPGLGGMAAPEARPLTYTGPAEDGGEVQTRGGDGGSAVAEPSRNAPCPCGSGRKYKRCHGAPTTAHS
jgi:preprotein translocase subunit SecA